MDFLSDCKPARVHIILSMITIIGAFFSRLPFFQILQVIISSAIWLGVLIWLCSKGFMRLSWFIVVFPFILLIGVIIFMIIALQINKTDVQTKNKQTAQTAQTAQTTQTTQTTQTAQTAQTRQKN